MVWHAAGRAAVRSTLPNRDRRGRVVSGANVRMLRYLREDLADDAAALDALITGPVYDAMPRERQVQALRRHAGMVWRLQDLDDQIADHEDPVPCP